MAEMDFYFNNKQIEELSKFIFDKGGRFIPDLDYKHDKYVTLADNETLKQYLGQTFHFFLIDKSFTSMPILLRQMMKDDEVIFYVNQRWGGPYIDFMFFPQFAKDSPLPYKRSNISYYPKFISPSSRYEVKAPDSLKEYYSSIVKHIKTSSMLAKHNDKKYWLGRETYPEIADHLKFSGFQLSK